MTYAEMVAKRNGHTLLEEQEEWRKELLPCPFCGCDLTEYPGVMLYELRYHEINADVWAVNCPNCGARATGDITIELAVKQWNHRVKKE